MKTPLFFHTTKSRIPSEKTPIKPIMCFPVLVWLYISQSTHHKICLFCRPRSQDTGYSVIKCHLFP